MKKASASLVVLSVIFLVTALLIYMFEYISIEKMMYVNRSRMKQFNYNYTSVENIISKDIETSYLNGDDIYDLDDKEYNVFEDQRAYIYINNVTNKSAFKIYYEERLSNNKICRKELYYTLLNKIFFLDNPKGEEKKAFYKSLLENDVQVFSTEEINNYFVDTIDEDKTFSFDNAVVKISQSDIGRIDPNIKGSGILIIDGDVELSGYIEFNGIIIIDGKFIINGESNSINGYVFDINNNSNINYNKSINTIYNKCKQYHGVIDVRRMNF